MGSFTEAQFGHAGQRYLIRSGIKSDAAHKYCGAPGISPLFSLPFVLVIIQGDGLILRRGLSLHGVVGISGPEGREGSRLIAAHDCDRDIVVAASFVGRVNQALAKRVEILILGRANAADFRVLQHGIEAV